MDMKFEYFTEDMVSVEMVLPSFGSVMGGTRVVVSMCCGEVVLPLQCVFGEGGAAEARVLGGGRVECLAPRANHTGEVTLHLSREGRRVSSQSGIYTYVVPAVVLGVNPSEGTQRTLVPRVKVAGEHFTRSHTLGCRFGSMVNPARYVTSTMIDCEVSKLVVGNYTVEVTTNGEDFTRGLAVYEVVPTMVVHKLVPSKGPGRGGSKVLVVGAGLRQGRGLACHFGRRHRRRAHS